MNHSNCRMKTAVRKGENDMGFKEIAVEELNFNPFTKIGKEWLLITAEIEESETH